MKSILGHDMNLGWGQVRAGMLEGAQLYLDLDNRVLQTMLDGTYDAYIYAMIEQNGLDLTGTVAWDVGAEIGYHSLMLGALVGDTGQVVAFEPNPHNVARIERQLERNPALAQRVEISPMALSDDEMPGEHAVDHLGPVVRRPPPFDELRVLVDDPVFRHLGALVVALGLIR
jgi:hypothetical protein